MSKRIIFLAAAAWLLLTAFLPVMHVDAVMQRCNCTLHEEYMSCCGPRNGWTWQACDYTIRWGEILAEPAECRRVFDKSYARRDIGRAMCFAGRAMIDGRICAAAWLRPAKDR